MYEVPDMQLMPQDQTMACWYASALMVLQWSRRGERMSQPATNLINPGAHPTINATYLTNNGLQWSQIRALAIELGLRELPTMTPSHTELERWFMSFGPVWTTGVGVDATGQPAGNGHIVVLAGIRPTSRPGESFELKIYDPWPPNVGDVSWRPASHLSIIQSLTASNPNRVAFLVKR